MKKAAVNWVKDLPSCTEALSQNPNLLHKTGNACAKEWDLPLDKYEDMVRPRPKDFRSRSKHVKATRKQALSATPKCANRTVNKEAKKHPPSIYDIGETVLIRYP